MQSSGVTLVALASVLLASTLAEVIKFTPCSDEDKCTVHEVSITPCPQTPEPCVLKKGKTAFVTVDFTPKFVANDLKSLLYWDSGFFNPSFPGMDDAACHYTTCPTAAGVRQKYEYRLELSKFFPSSTYPIKWQLWNQDESSQGCCFQSYIKLKS